MVQHLTVEEKYRLKAFGIRARRRILEFNRKDVIAEIRKTICALHLTARRVSNKAGEILGFEV